MDKGKGLASEIEELLNEFSPDRLAADIGLQGKYNNLVRENMYRMEREVNLPSGSGYNSNQQSMAMNMEKNHQVAARTTSNVNPGVWQQSRHTSALLESTSRIKNPIDWVNPTLLESAHRVEMENSTDWVNPAFHEILLMKQKYLSQVITLFHTAREGRHRVRNAELAMKYECNRSLAERIFVFLNMSMADLLQYKKEQLYKSMNDIMNYLDRAMQFQQAVASFISQMRSSEQLLAPQGNVASSPREGPQIGFDQNALGMFRHSNGVAHGNGLSTSPQQIDPVYRNIFNSLDYNSKTSLVVQSSGAVNPTPQIILQKRKDYTNSRQFPGLNQKQSPQKSFSTSISSEYSEEYSPQLELKNLSSITAKTGRQFASSSASDDSGKIPSPAPAQIALQEMNRNQIVPDTLGTSCLHEESNDKQQSVVKRDPLEYLIEVVTTIQYAALKDALQDMYAATTLSDRGAVPFLDCESNKVGFQDLADGNITHCDFGVSSRMKRRLDSVTTLDYMTEMEFCGGEKIKRPKKEPNGLLLQEIREINQKFLEVVVDVKDVPTTGCNKGTLVRCSYTPSTFSRNINSPNTSEQMFPNLILELIVTDDYPNASPTILETTPSRYSDGEEWGYLCTQAKSTMSSSLKKYSEPISLREIAKSWDVCCRELFCKFAGEVGVGSACNSGFGKWETCIAAS